MSTADVDNALAIYGASVPALKGKTAKKKPAVVTRDLVKVPREFMKLVKDVTLCVDFFFVNKIPFIITLSLKIYFTTVTHLDNRKIGTILTAIKLLCAFYQRCGYRVVELRMDGEFQAIHAPAG